MDRRRTAGQSLVEFALLLPLLLALIGVILDVSRLYQTWLNLEAGTNDAAQYIASSGGTTDPTWAGKYSPAGVNDTTNNATAVSVLNAATGQTFTAVSSLGTCDVPRLTTTMEWTTSATVGASTAYPRGHARVTACAPFRTLFPYPFLTINGAWVLRSEKDFWTIVGR